VSWQDQGRQKHGWFGDGKGAEKPKDAPGSGSVFGPGRLAQRIQAVAHGSIGALPQALRARAAAQYDAGNMARLTEVMTALSSGARLSNAEFADRFFGRTADDPIVEKLHDAAVDVGSATSHAKLREAAEKVANAMQAIGLDRWPRFLADAQDRARAPATIAAIAKSVQPQESREIGIRPVYPVETLMGIGAAGIVGGIAGAARAVGGAVLRQILPVNRPAAGNISESATQRSAATETPANTSETAGKQAEPTPSGQSVRLREGQQGKHVEGSNSYIPTRSTLTANPRALLERFAGRGRQIGRKPVGTAGSKEVFDAGKQIIGIYRTQAGRSAPTTRGIIHYSNKGAHIVPAAPRNWQP
jgi:putative RNase toxin 50 of polymorphic toxin system